MSFSAFGFEIQDSVAHITLNQPERGNPLDECFCAEFNAIATVCASDPAVRAVLIDAKGRFFSVGGDLQSLTRDRADLARFVLSATANLHMGVARFARMRAPVIMAVHALAAGGAVALAAAADFVLAAPGAAFYAAFTGIGICGDSGTSHYLPRRVGPRRAAEFLILNETWSAQAAREAGLITRVVEEDRLQIEALALAQKLADGPTRAFGEIKALLLDSPTRSLEAQLEQEAHAMVRCVQTEDAWNGMGAVKGKTKPAFEGR